MVHFDGFDVTKELLYQRTGEEFRRRGIALLIVDHPGVGEALRLRNMSGGLDTEVSAAAFVDYLQTRPDVDSQRIGVMANSLGGYYAPRAAAFEKRFKCCVAWGAIWDFGIRTTMRLSGKGGELSLAEGGAEHCMADNSSMAVDYMADWIAEILGGNPKGV